MHTKRKIWKAGAMLLLLFLLVRCKDDVISDEYYEKPDPELPLIAGSATVNDGGVDAYSHLIPDMNASVAGQHAVGSDVFFATFTENPDGEYSGLGPLYIQNSCVGCHPGNGRSQPPLSEVDYNSGLLMRFSLAGEGPHGEPIAVPGYGTQLQTQGVSGNEAEALYIFSYSNAVITYADGNSVTLHNPSHILINEYAPLPDNILFSMRNASPIYGLGLLEAISESDILALADETDADGNYISGRPNFVWNVKTQQEELGRFGWKSSAPTIEHQVAGAFNEDMGITSEGYFPVENCSGQANCSGASASPDITEQTIDDLATYVRTLAVPNWRNQDDPTVQRGKEVFNELKCNLCHHEEFTTSGSVLPELNGIVIHPFTDMLIHDMGEVLADGRPDFHASTNEWRTSPLWGIGLTKLINPDARFLHDGRAETLEEAILWHGGEAHWTIEYFKQLPQADRDALITFLESL
ncbi:MAG: thiol oxidoreductase [Flavobacteriales bacterium]|nr:thiol oxidoreductase [Flavobacteriales bacterium]